MMPHGASHDSKHLTLWQRCQQFCMPLVNPMAHIEKLIQATCESMDAASLFAKSAQAHEAERQFQFQRAHSGMQGENISPFKGQGMDFAELREYSPGDDIRKMDWQVFARTQIPHIRDYQEERQLTVWLVLEESAALGLGPASYYQQTPLQEINSEQYHPISDKKLRAYELLLRLGRAAQSANAKIGFFHILGESYRVIKPTSGQAQLLRIAESLFNDKLSPLSSEQPLEALQHLTLKQDWVMFITDATNMSATSEQALGLIAQKTHLNSFAILDEREWVISDFMKHLPLTKPNAKRLKGKPVQKLSGLSLSSLALLESSFSSFKRIGPLYPVPVQTPIEDVLHQWMKGLKGMSPSTRRRAKRGAG